MNNYQDNKALVRSYYEEMESAGADTVGDVLARHTSADFQWYGVYPWNEQHGSGAVVDTFWKPLMHAWTGLQRRPDIFFSGTNDVDGDSEWVVSIGHFMGLLDHDWLGIPATRKLTLLPYAEFSCVKDGKIISGSFFCDIISVMNQAGLQPLPPQTAAAGIYLGPRTHDGLLYEPQDEAEGVATLALVNRMINEHTELNLSGVDFFPSEQIAKTWHKDMTWFGPAGIGATYTIPRYQEQHQRPFREGLTSKVFNGHVCRMAEGNYAGFFGWPNLTNSPAGGFLGMPASDLSADMRVVDLYRRDGDKLAENWIFIDLPYWLKQQGLDILERTRSICNP